jgi:hypothetical protein
MNVEIGTVATQLLFEEYLFRIVGIVVFAVHFSSKIYCWRSLVKKAV